MKKLFMILTMFSVLLLFVFYGDGKAFAENDISICLNGEKVILDQPPIIKNGRTLVPLRGVVEAMGATAIGIQIQKQLKYQPTNCIF